MARPVILAAMAMVASLAAAVAVGPFYAGDPAVDHVTDDRLLRPVADGGAVWPYTSRSRSAAGRTLALNVVVVSDPSVLRRTLTGRTDREWSTARGHAGVELVQGGLRWRPARGATRFTYVRRPGDAGEWVRPAYQLQSGTYFGRRLHVRAYPGPNGTWTAFQVHGEQWDWFRLRHTVTSVAAAARSVEADLRTGPAAEVHREAHGLTGGGSEGWISVVELAAVALAIPLGASFAGDERRWPHLQTRHLLLPTAVASGYLGVRAAGIALETVLPAIPPKAVVALLYPMLVAGVPYAAVRFARPFRRQRDGDVDGRSVDAPITPALAAAVLAGGGFLVALAVDATVLDLARLPGRLVLHRLTLAVALGSLAAGSVLTDRRLHVVGLAGWLLGLAAPLLGVV